MRTLNCAAVVTIGDKKIESIINYVNDVFDSNEYYSLVFQLQ